MIPDDPSTHAASLRTPRVDGRWIVAIVLVCALVGSAAPTRSDPDLWGHMRFGLDVLANRTLPTVDPYSFTQDRPELYHEWLGAVIIAAVYTLAGTAGVVWLKLAICCGIFYTFKDRLLRLTLTDAGLVAFLVAWTIIPITLFVRPQLWTVLAVLLLVRLLDERRYWWVPPLFALWANLHGGWVMGLGILGVWCAATACEAWWRTRHVPVRIVLLPAVAFLATMLNPYGWRLWQFLGETVGLSRADIGDWQPLFATWDIDQLPVVITIALLVAVSVRARTRPSLPWLLVCAVLIYSSVRVSRVAFVSMPAILLIILPSLALWLPRGKTAKTSAPARFGAITFVPLAIAATLTGVVIAPVFRCLPIRGEWIPDAAAVPVLQQGIDGGRIVTWFDWGEYALWHLGPRLKISMDGRRETLYSERLLSTHYSIYDNGDAGHAWLLEERPEYVWLKSVHAGVRDWLALHGYRIDWQSETSYVAVRADLPRLSGAATIASSGCFPGP